MVVDAVVEEVQEVEVGLVVIVLIVTILQSEKAEALVYTPVG